METIEFLHGKTPVTLHTHDKPDHLHNLISSARNFYELDLLQTAAKLYRKGSWVIDVGANIGNHTVYFAKIMSAKVLAFEPYEKSRNVLTANIAANGCGEAVVVNSHALGDTTGRARAASPNPGNLGMVSVAAHAEGDLPIAKLDDCVTLGMNVSVLKVDVEGNEIAVLRGAARTLAIHRPHIFVEAGKPAEFEKVNEFLTMFGYQVAGQFAVTPTYLFSA